MQTHLPGMLCQTWEIWDNVCELSSFFGYWQICFLATTGHRRVDITALVFWQGLRCHFVANEWVKFYLSASWFRYSGRLCWGLSLMEWQVPCTVINLGFLCTQRACQAAPPAFQKANPLHSDVLCWQHSKDWVFPLLFVRRPLRVMVGIFAFPHNTFVFPPCILQITVML